tara:strand:+ start:1501 stop:2556 length:1056 start_codon:yes stop_codon:yes gene_type:complete
VIKESFILKVNTKNLIHNYNFFKKINKNIIVAATIKANAYGLGDNNIFKLLIKNGCKHFFVATLEEGVRLNNKNRNISIYVLNGIQNHNIKIFANNNLIPIINTLTELERILKDKIDFGIHVDTGLNRLGISHNDIPEIVFKNKKIKIMISHLASADEKNNNYNYLQKKYFLNVAKNFKNKVIFSLANSSGSVLSETFLFDMIRPGIALYGGNNNNKNLVKKLQPVIILSGKIIQIKTINKNEFIGYNQTYLTNKKIKAAVIGVGYADGLPRQISNKGIVYYKKNKFKIIGRISMDSFTIDISNSKDKLKEGIFVDLINYKYGIDNFAKQCNTISNEVITSIGARVKKIYV